MRFIKILLFLFFIVLEVNASSDTQIVQKKNPSQEPHFTSPLIFKSGEEYEITKIDITTIPNINSLKISVKGVKLGDKKEQVMKLLGHPDEINEMGIYFYKESSVPLFAIVFDSENTVRRIVLFPQFAKYVIGNTKKLLNHQIATDEELRFFLLGVEDDKIKAPTGRITFRYLKEGFEFTYFKMGNDIEDFMFFLKYPAKIR
ncbi:MAG: hypothetical protein N2202_06690 [Proteobacteria bacterium]|nr:hypothetical protein [Pseudomonadota bacterium]